MATVHRAIERGIEGFERVVALKRLLPHLAEDEGFVRAFVREAKLASLLQHANIVQLFELGRVGASYFISMEYIPGRDLRVILRQARRVCGPPSVEIALALLTELLDALDYAHSQCGGDGKPLGLVHRDISPSNLIVGNTGHLKVIDFGIAKATLGHLMTHTGRIKGKLSYMAPELLAGRTPDGRSDLFSASVIAHELLTATPLFAAKDDFQTIDRLQNMRPPPPSSRNATCPPELDDIVLRGLTKDPSQRWSSASEMRAALAELAIHHHRLATNREVSDWVEDAFEMPLPSRLRLSPVAPERGKLVEHKRSGPVGATDWDDEIMDIVWGVTSPRSPMGVVLDDVPDVSGRLALGNGREVLAGPATPSFEPLDRREPIEAREARVANLVVGSLLVGGEDDPTNLTTRSFEPDTRETLDLAPPARGSFRAGGAQPVAVAPSVATTSAAPAAERRSDGAPVATQPRPTAEERRTMRPAAWALGTASNPQQPDGQTFKDVASAARHPRPPPALAAVNFAGRPDQRQGLSPMPLLVASIAVAVAGAGLAWIISSGDEDQPTRLAENTQSVAPAQARVQPLPQEQEAAHTTSAPPPADSAREPSPGALEQGEEQLDQGLDHLAEGHKHRSRPKRDSGDDHVRGARERSAPELGGAASAEGNEHIEGAGEEPGDRSGGEHEGIVGGSVVAKSESPPQPPDGPASKAAIGSVSQGGLEPLPVPGPGSTTEPTPGSAAEPRRPREPIIVPANRTRREEGGVQPIRFARWERLPKQITAKLCIDTQGAVTSVNVLSPTSAGVRDTVQRALSGWRYRPVVEGDQKVAACFATTFRVQLE